MMMLVVLIVLVFFMVVVPSFDSFRWRYLSSNRHMRKLFEAPKNVEVTSASGGDGSMLLLASRYADQFDSY